jgi:membrane-associated phospholipid phosphatase
MTTTLRTTRALAAASLILLLGQAAPVFAQGMAQTFPAATSSAQPPTINAKSPTSTWKGLFGETLREFGQLPSRDSAKWLVAGVAMAAVVHPWDNNISDSLSGATDLGPSVRPGAVLGSTPFQLGGAFALYSVGRLSHHPRLAHVGGDLVRAQLLAEGMTLGIKQSVRRSRPEGSGFSFPSGHTTVSFASATVLQRHFGWHVGLPAYGVAGYIALSRVQMRRHYLSDVALGAALGVIAGRTITVGHEHAVQLSPMATAGGAGVQFTWIGRKP